MGGGVSLQQIYQLPEIIDQQLFMSITKYKFTLESYDIFADREGQISRERMKEIINTRDCYLSFDWGYDNNGKSGYNRAQIVQEFLAEKGLYVYLEDGSYKHNAAMGDMSMRERIKQSLVQSSCLIIFLTERYYQKLIESKENQIQIEFYEFLSLKGIRSIVPCILEEKGRVTPINTPPKIYELFQSKFCVNLMEFEFCHQQLEDLYEFILKTIKPLREGGNFTRQDADYASTPEGKHWHWLSQRFVIEDLQSIPATTTATETTTTEAGTSENPNIEAKAKSNNNNSNNNNTDLILSNLKNIDKPKIAKDILKKYAKIFADNEFESPTRIFPLIQINDHYLVDIGISKVHSKYLRKEILKDIKENFDSNNFSKIDGILLQKKKTMTKEEEEKNRKLQQILENAQRMKELSFMAFEDTLSFSLQQFNQMIEKQIEFARKQLFLTQQIISDNDKYNFLVVSLQESYQRRKDTEIQEMRMRNYQRIISAESIFEIMQYFRENLKQIDDITLKANEYDSNNNSDLMKYIQQQPPQLLRNSMSQSLAAMSPKKTRTVDTSFLTPNKKVALSQSRSMDRSLSFSPTNHQNHKQLIPEYSAKEAAEFPLEEETPLKSSNHHATNSKMKLVPYGITKQQIIHSEISATVDPNELSFQLQESVYIFKKMELLIENSLENVSTYIENGVVKLLLTFLAQQYIHQFHFNSSAFLKDFPFFELSLPHQPLILLTHLVRHRVDYHSLHTQLIFLLHRHGIVPLLFEIMKFYIEKIDLLSIILYLMDLLFTTREYPVLSSYVSVLLKRDDDRNNQNPASKNNNEFYLLMMMILLEKYYYHKEITEENKMICLTPQLEPSLPSSPLMGANNRKSPMMLVRKSSFTKLVPVASPPQTLSKTVSQSSSSMNPTTPHNNTYRSPSHDKNQHFNRQVHLLYEPHYREMFFMIVSIFCKLASLEVYDALLIRCREKLITTLMNEIIEIPITNLGIENQYFYNFLFSLETIYYTKLMVFLPQNSIDSRYYLSERYGVYDTTISYYEKKEFLSSITHFSSSFEGNNLNRKRKMNRKLTEKMILQLNEFRLIKYLINCFQYYCYHHFYQSLEMMISVIRVIGNMIYLRNDLKKICNEMNFFKDLIYCLRIGIEMILYCNHGDSLNLAVIHEILQQQDRERNHSQKKGKNESPKSPKKYFWKKNSQNEMKEIEEEEGKEDVNEAKDESIERSLKLKNAANANGISINTNNNNLPPPTSSPFATSPNKKAIAGQYINQTRLKGIELICETFQTFNNLIAIYSNKNKNKASPPTDSSSPKPTLPKKNNSFKLYSNNEEDEQKFDCPKWDCLYLCMEKLNLGELLMDIFSFIHQDQRLFYSFLLFLVKITQKGNYVVNNRLFLLGFIEKFLSFLELNFLSKMNYQDKISYDIYLLLTQFFVNIISTDPIRVNPMKKLFPKKRFLIEFIMASMKRFCLFDENEFSFRYTHYYSQYILLIHDKHYLKEWKLSNNNKSTNDDDNDGNEEKENVPSSFSPSRKMKKSPEKKEKEVKPRKDEEKEIPSLDYSQHVCVSCLLSCKLIYCFLQRNESEKEILQEFRDHGINKILLSSKSPGVIGEIHDLLPVLYADPKKVPRQELVFTEEEKKNKTSIDEENANNETKDEQEEKPRDLSENERVYLIPIQDLSTHFMAEKNAPLFSSESTKNPVGGTTRGIDNHRDHHSNQFNYFFSLNRNIELLENIEKHEFDTIVRYLFRQFHINY
jgi:hypothetical protein